MSDINNCISTRHLKIQLSLRFGVLFPGLITYLLYLDINYECVRLEQYLNTYYVKEFLFIT